jgi:membrane protein CcdC involved in cytochrome C biogenesis
VARSRRPHSCHRAKDCDSTAGHVHRLLLAWPLVATSRLVRDGDAIMMHRSAAFFIVIVALALIRFLARSYLDSVMTLEQTGGLFFILAFGMILRWRVRMLMEYRTLTRT